MAAFITRSVTESDQPRWRELFNGYAAFYKSPMDDDIAARGWPMCAHARDPLDNPALQ